MRLLFFFCIISLFGEISVLPLGDLGSVRYVSKDQRLLRVERVSPSDELMYVHSYHYDEDGKLISEDLIGELGEVIYDSTTIKTPFSLEICEYDERGNPSRHVLDGVSREYFFDSNNKLILDEFQNSCVYDSYGNVIENNGIKYSYDERNNLIQIFTPQSVVEYTYDSSGKRVSKTCDSKSEHYVYFGINELAILDDNCFVNELRIPGLSPHKDILRPIAIETIEGIFAPIHDAYGNIIRLINISNKEVIAIDELDPYGIGLSENLPISWIYSGKHYDPDADLVYFGSRFYSPQLRQWLTPMAYARSIASNFRSLSILF